MKRGDLLITGFIPPGDPAHESLVQAGNPPYVRAEGVVTARVWYEGKASVPLVQAVEEPTGAQWALELEWGPKRWPAWAVRDPALRLCGKSGARGDFL